MARAAALDARFSARVVGRARARAMATTPRYFDDSYAYASRARVVRTTERDDATGTSIVVLDETIAYPAGGGQPSDRGRMTSASGASSFAFERVRRLADGAIEHEGRFDAGNDSFRDGEDVEVEIDGAARRLHARIHSAGHALDVAMIRIGLGPEVLTPTKGMHEPTQAYVEYKGKLAPEHEFSNVDALMTRLNEEMTRIIEENGASKAEELSYEDAKAACGGELPPFITEDMTPRIVTIVPDTPGCPCGGTHIKAMSEIEDFRLTGVRTKKGTTRLSYTIPGMETWTA